MRFLVVVGLSSLLIGGVSVWTGISAYIAERASVIAVMRSVGASRARIFLHFFAQVATLALVGVGIGLLIGAGTGLVALPIVGQAIGVALPPASTRNRCSSPPQSAWSQPSHLLIFRCSRRSTSNRSSCSAPGGSLRRSSPGAP